MAATWAVPSPIAGVVAAAIRHYYGEHFPALRPSRELRPAHHGYRLLRALRSRLFRFSNHGWTQINTDKCAMGEVGHNFEPDARRGSLSVSIRVDPWFVQVLDMRRQAQC